MADAMVPLDRLLALREVIEPPAPSKPVADRTPVDGTKDSLVEVTFCTTLPEEANAQVG